MTKALEGFSKLLTKASMTNLDLQGRVKELEAENFEFMLLITRLKKELKIERQINKENGNVEP